MSELLQAVLSDETARNSYALQRIAAQAPGDYLPWNG